MSKVIDGDQLIDCMMKTTNAVVISHEREATIRLFSAVKFFIDNMDPKPITSIDSKSEIKFPKMNSSYFIGTAGQRAAGRGDTVDRAHLSEAAFYEDLERILNGIAEAAEYGQIDIETTPNGREAFYDMWEKAKTGKSSYTPIFIPWFINREYNVNKLLVTEKEGLSRSVIDLIEMPDVEFLASLDEEERRVVKMVAREYGIQLLPGELKWRRYKIWDKGQLFFQEYPEDDVSCFLQTGRSVFTKITTDASLRIPLDDIDSWQASEADKEALKMKTLYAGLDGAAGTKGGDRHCFAVLDINKQAGKGAFIFEYTSNEPIDVFCYKVAEICKQFPIKLGVENNGVGLAHVNKLYDYGVALETWNTSSVSRPVMMTDLEEAYRKEEIIETYDAAEQEARDMQYGAAGRPEHPAGKHDDRVFARAIALQMTKQGYVGF